MGALVCREAKYASRTGRTRHDHRGASVFASRCAHIVHPPKHSRYINFSKAKSVPFDGKVKVAFSKVLLVHKRRVYS